MSVLALTIALLASQQTPDTALAFVSQNLARGNGNWYTYYRISDKQLPIKAGDVLVYSLFLDPRDPVAKGAVDIEFTDGGQEMRDLGLFDQNGARAHGDGQLPQAMGKWYMRRINLDKAAGRTSSSWNVNFEGDREGTYAAFFDDIYLEHKDGTREPIYVSGPPPARGLISAEGYTKFPTLVVVDRSRVTDGANVSDLVAAALKQGEKMRSLESAQMDIDFAKKFLANNPNPELEGHIKEAEAMINRLQMKDPSTDEIQQAIHAAKHALSHTHPVMEKYTGHLVGHAHIDLQWLWEWQEGIIATHDTFNQATKFMDEFPGFTFSQSSSCLYQTTEEHYPDLFKKIQEKVKKGQWEIVGGRVCEGDTNMISPESTARHFLYGQRYFREKFGKTAVVGWEPDTFGHNAQMPQILKLGGCNYYYFCRGGKGKPLFWWEGLDGTKILTFDEPATGSWYNSDLSYKQFQEMLDFEKFTGSSKDMLWVYGVGNHGGGPTREYIQTALEWMKDPTKPKVKFSTATQFFKKLETYNLSKIPTIKDELNPVFDGCYTSHSEVKQLNRQAEAATTSAETLSAVASLVGGFKYPKANFRKSWEDITFNHHHDTLPGSGIHAPYERTKTTLGRVIADDKEIATRAMESMVIRVTPKKGGISVMVFNPTGWERDAWIETYLVKSGWDGGERLDLDNLVAEAPDGEKNPVILLDRPSRLGRFWAKDVQPFGYRVFWIHNAPNVNPAPQVRDDGFTFESSRFIVEFDRQNGGIKRLYSKPAKAELVKPGGQLGRLEVHYEQPGGMSAWVIGKIGSVENVKLVNATSRALPDGIAVDLDYELDTRGRISRIRQEFTARNEDRQIECRVDCDWQAIGTGRTPNPMLRVAFDSSDLNPTANYQIPFGFISRPTDGTEWPALEWGDLGTPTSGFSILNDSKHGYSASGSTMRLSLIRSSFDPDPVPNPGPHTWHYAIRPRAQVDFARLARVAAEFNQPMIPATVPFDAQGKAPLDYAPLELTDPRLVPTVLKLAEDGNDLILRFYEAAGMRQGKGDLDLRLPVAGIQPVNFIEDAIGKEMLVSAKSVPIPSTEFKIQTLKLRLKKP